MSEQEWCTSCIHPIDKCTCYGKKLHKKIDELEEEIAILKLALCYAVFDVSKSNSEEILQEDYDLYIAEGRDQLEKIK